MSDYAWGVLMGQESPTGWGNRPRLPLGHSRVPMWLGEPSEPVRKQPRGPSPRVRLRALAYRIRRALAGWRQAGAEIDEANYWNRLNFLELKHDENLPEREP